MTVQFDVVLEEDGSDLWLARVPGLHACQTQARTPEEAMERIPEVIRLCLRATQPRPSRIERIDVA